MREERPFTTQQSGQWILGHRGCRSRRVGTAVGGCWLDMGGPWLDMGSLPRAQRCRAVLGSSCAWTGKPEQLA